MQFDLVFEGGGAKGIVFVGALEVFEGAGHTFDRLIGTSAGAITATLLAAGYTAVDMLPQLSETSDGRPVFETFMGSPPDVSAEDAHQSALRDLLRTLDLPLVPGFIEDGLDDRLTEAIANHGRLRHLYSFIEQGGWFSAHAFVAWLRSKLDAGTFNGTPRRFSALTMRPFYDATGVELTLTGSDTTDGRLLVLNHRTAPDLPVVWAVRMSMSVPLLWQEVVWQAEWGLYLGQSLAGHAIVDGGLLSNFPIELLLSTEPPVVAVMGEKRNQNVMGFLIDEALPVAGAQETDQASALASLGELETVRRLKGLVDTVTSARDKMVIDAFENQVVRLPARGYGTTEFGMTPARRDLLVAAGRQAMADYLAQPPVDKAIDLAALERAQSAADRIAIGILSR